MNFSKACMAGAAFAILSVMAITGCSKRLENEEVKANAPAALRFGFPAKRSLQPFQVYTDVHIQNRAAVIFGRVNLVS